MTNTMNTSTHIHLLLDRSGSMAAIANDVIGGFNSFLREQQQNGPDARITLVQFDTQDPQEVLLSGAPISSAQPLDAQTFSPRAGTPLLDATGRLIERARLEEGLRAQNGLPKEHILFVSITDGEENSSRHYTGARIRKMIQECEAAGWTFVFLSAALDAYGEARQLGVRDGSTQAFMADSGGVSHAMRSLSARTVEFRQKRRDGHAAEHDDFFGADKPAEEDRNSKTDGSRS
jgi:Mg-chelatase subunit ChlD